MTNKENIDIDALLENEHSTVYAQEVKDVIHKAQAEGKIELLFNRVSLCDAFPPERGSDTPYRSSWFTAYLKKHCPGWGIAAGSSKESVRIKYRSS